MSPNTRITYNLSHGKAPCESHNGSSAWIRSEVFRFKNTGTDRQGDTHKKTEKKQISGILGLAARERRKKTEDNRMMD
ncbi:hypothetical protein ElyMa_004383300 [Elysia marginata]|uniref:Uncharacterized protein n=1 Tax=Elysia marginata TaxID=1093978 RepID=A0AAV4H957_9GAST|nr:hypothetical protein ElyMa_004383300 [Elysia marginata]